MSNSLDRDHAQCFAGPDLGPKLFAKVISRPQKLPQVGKELLCLTSGNIDTFGGISPKDPNVSKLEGGLDTIKYMGSTKFDNYQIPYNKLNPIKYNKGNVSFEYMNHKSRIPKTMPSLQCW